MTVRKTNARVSTVKIATVNAKIAAMATGALKHSSDGKALAGLIDAALTAAKACPATAQHAMEMVRDEFKAAHIAGRIVSNGNDVAKLAAARAILAMANSKGTGKLKKGQKRRTPEQDKAYSAAGVAWSRILAETGHAPVKAAPTKRGTKKKADAKPTADAPKLPKNVLPFVPPAKADKLAFVAYVTDMSAALLTKCESTNQSLMKTSDETLPLFVSDAIAAFRNAICEGIKRQG